MRDRVLLLQPTEEYPQFLSFWTSLQLIFREQNGGQAANPPKPIKIPQAPGVRARPAKPEIGAGVIWLLDHPIGPSKPFEFQRRTSLASSAVFADFAVARCHLLSDFLWFSMIFLLAEAPGWERAAAAHQTTGLNQHADTFLCNAMRGANFQCFARRKSVGKKDKTQTRHVFQNANILFLRFSGAPGLQTA